MELCGSYRVTAIAKPIDALIYLKKYRPDLILLDYKMPEMSGTELFAKIEADSGVRTLTLENTLPDVRGNTTMIYRSRHMLTKIYLDDSLVYDQSIYAAKNSTWFGMEENVFIEVPLREYDSGKRVTIVSTASISNYLTNPGLVYLGERSSLHRMYGCFWWMM